MIYLRNGICGMIRSAFFLSSLIFANEARSQAQTQALTSPKIPKSTVIFDEACIAKHADSILSKNFELLKKQAQVNYPTQHASNSYSAPNFLVTCPAWMLAISTQKSDNIGTQYSTTCSMDEGTKMLFADGALAMAKMEAASQENHECRVTISEAEASVIYLREVRRLLEELIIRIDGLSIIPPAEADPASLQ